MLRSALSLWFQTKDPTPALCSALPWKHLGRTTSLNVGFPSYYNTWSSTWIEMVNLRVDTHTHAHTHRDVLMAQIPDSPLYSLIPSFSLPVSRLPPSRCASERAVSSVRPCGEDQAAEAEVGQGGGGGPGAGGGRVHRGLPPQALPQGAPRGAHTGAPAQGPGRQPRRY